MPKGLSDETQSLASSGRCSVAGLSCLSRVVDPALLAAVGSVRLHGTALVGMYRDNPTNGGYRISATSATPRSVAMIRHKILCPAPTRVESALPYRGREISVYIRDTLGAGRCVGQPCVSAGERGIWRSASRAGCCRCSPGGRREVGALLPEVYLHGLAEGDFELALRGLLGDGAPLSKASIQRLRGALAVAVAPLPESAFERQRAGLVPRRSDGGRRNWEDAGAGLDQVDVVEVIEGNRAGPRAPLIAFTHSSKDVTSLCTTR